MPEQSAISFMPTFTAASDSGLDVLASVAISNAQTGQSGLTPLATSSVLSTKVTEPDQITIPGLAAIPLKIVKPIWDLDLTELLPETWRLEEAQGDSCCRSQRPKRALLTDMLCHACCRYSTPRKPHSSWHTCG